MDEKRRQRILDLADGRIPDGIDPDSSQGRHYAALIAYGDAELAKAPPMTEAQKTRVVALLRGGGDHRAA